MYWLPIALLIISNVFMTVAWYGHLKGPLARRSLPFVIVASWLIAFLEYCFQVPANRIGYQQHYSGAQLKIVQEAITLLVFAGFSVTYLKEPLKWNYLVGFTMMLGAVFFVFKKW